MFLARRGKASSHPTPRISSRHMHDTCPSSKLAWVPLLGFASLLAACGGGNNSDTAAPSAQQVSATDAATKTQLASGLSTSASTSTTLTVRAKGSPASGTWPLMQVRVNGVVVGTTVVQSPDYTDHRFDIAEFPATPDIDVTFLNDWFANGEDRNLYVESISYAGTTVLSTAPQVRYDRGNGDLAYDDADVIPGQAEMYWAGSLRFSAPPNADITCGLPDFQAALLAQVNAARAAGAMCGGTAYPPAGALRWSPKLQDAAAGHSIEMASIGQGISHTSQDGRTPADRIRATGYTASYYGENVAAGYGSVEAVMAGWMNHPPHCANIMSASFQEIGAACSKRSGSDYGTYWTMDLARPQ